MICANCSAALGPTARFCENCGTKVEAAPAAQQTDVPGPVAEGRFVARALLGTGARKQVWLAGDTRLGRDVALALVRTDGLDEAGRLRIDREARVMARLGDHPNVVTVLDVGLHDGAPYIVSQFMSGGTLAERLDQAPDHRLGVEEAIDVATGMTRALEHAHATGVMHRDVKPANVFFGADGTAQLGDFGLAAELDEARLTAEGMVVGTVAYLPPEQTLGLELNPRSDIYSLGCVLYEMVTGRPPFVGDSAVGVISQHLRADPVAPRWHQPATPEQLDELIRAMLAKSPDDRPDATRVLTVLSSVAPVAAAPQAEIRPGTAAATAPAEWGRYVGRVHEQDQLRGALDEALAGRARVMMVVGEPGIGKTRTVEELAAEATVRGARVMWGHAYEGDIGAPYLPFVDALRGFTRDLPTPTLVDVLASDVAEIASLVPDITTRIPDIETLPRLDGEAERYRLYEAVTSFLRNASRHTPLMLVLEDLHWADKPSLLLLQYLARSLDADRLLIVCTYRDVELERTHPLAATLMALRREHLYDRVLLQGMTVEEVHALVEAIGGQPAPLEFAERLHIETRGNPFFVAEILQHLVESGTIRYEDGQWVGSADSVELALPEGVRDVIGRRLDRLSPQCNRLLTVAAAMTSGFDLDTVRAVADVDEDEALDLLDEALAARILQERKEPKGTFDFTHALIRQTLYAELSTPRRVRLHRQLLEVLESRGADVAELAHHAFQSITAGDVSAARRYAREAGERALGALAHEEAVRHFDLALQACDLADDDEAPERAEILISLAGAQRLTGSLGAARRAADEATVIGRQLDRPDFVARAVLEMTTDTSGLVGYDAELVELYEHAAAGLAGSEAHRGLRARVLNAHALHVWGTGNDFDVAAGLLTEAHTDALAAGDDEILCVILQAVRLICGSVREPDAFLEAWALPVDARGDADVLTRPTLTRRIAELRSESDVQSEWWDVGHRFFRSLADADRDALDDAIGAMTQLAARSRSPLMRATARLRAAVVAVIDGRYDDASAAIGDYAELMRAGEGGSDARAQIGVALTPMLREQGRLAALLEPTRQVVASGNSNPSWIGGFALVLSELGHVDEATTLVDEMVIHDPGALTVAGTQTYAPAMFAEVACAIGHVDAAERLADVLGSARDPAVPLGPFAWYGATDRYRGLVAHVLGRHDDAVAHHRGAIALTDAMRARSWATRSRYDLARALRSRGDDGDQAEAVALLNDALVAATEIGMTRLIEDVTAEKLLLQGVDPDAEVTGSIASVVSMVRTDRPSLDGAVDGRLTLLFSDIEGYTAMNERLGDVEAHRVLRAHNEILRRHLAAHGGTEVKSEGDGFMLTFPNPIDACRFALGFDAELAALDFGGDVGPVRVRMGIHTGDVIRDEEDFFGRTVIIAARIASVAEGGEVLMSAEVAEAARRNHLSVDAGRPVSLKGLSGTHDVHALRRS